MGKFDWAVWYIIIFPYVQFCIRLVAISYHGKKFRTVASSAVRSVNKSRDTRYYIQNEPEFVISVIFSTRFYYKVLGLIFVSSDMANTPQLQSSWRWPLMLQVTARCQCLARLVPWWQPMKFPQWCDRLRDLNGFAFCKTYWKWKRVMGFTLWCFP